MGRTPEKPVCATICGCSVSIKMHIYYDFASPPVGEQEQGQEQGRGQVQDVVASG